MSRLTHVLISLPVHVAHPLELAITAQSITFLKEREICEISQQNDEENDKSLMEKLEAVLEQISCGRYLFI